MLDEVRAEQEGGAWFVYLFASSDCTTFKVGFTCSPLQRIHTFSRRYFERFDLQQSQILMLEHCAVARDIESKLKRALAEFRSAAPPWLPEAAGGHTEWFSAVQFLDALVLLEECAAERGAPACLSAFELLRAELARHCGEFELWAWQRVRDLGSERGWMRSVGKTASTLRDWLDAYRYCEIPLFVDDPGMAQCVFEAVRLQWPPGAH